jgi:hypothetical protein
LAFSSVAASDARVDAELRRHDDTASQLVDLVQKACAATRTAFKADKMMWGVTRDGDGDGIRMTTVRFGDYKSPLRLKTEAKLREYMQKPTEPRASGLGLSDYSIAVTVAAPGTGKTRLLDDALRMSLDKTHFAHVLRLAITFNGYTNGAFAHPIATRVLRDFFCGPADDVATDVLKKIDQQLSRLFPDDHSDRVARRVLDAIETLYFELRGGVLGRMVLLIDEVSKAAIVVSAGADEKFESLVYRTVVSWVDMGKGRRGAVFTGLTVPSRWKDVSPSGRELVWLPLGKFDLWDAAVQRAVEHEVRILWPDLGEIDHRLWSLLAATGGRPRDVLIVLKRLKDWRTNLANADDEAPLSALHAVDTDLTFSRYLLPSMLGVTFDTFRSGRPTQFGNDAASSALLNADLLASQQVDVPAVSLRYSRSFPLSADHLLQVFAALVKATVFCKLDGGGKDFERAWVLLTYTVLQLQFLVRTSATAADFWPKLAVGVVNLGGPARPTAKEIDVFADDDRAEALFARPDDDLVFEAPGSTIRRKILIRRKPTLALWKNAWTATVEPGAADDVPDGWPMTLDVEWRPWTVVYFSDATNAAIDFMLLVGEACGTGDKEPHVYMFQCRAVSATLTQGGLDDVVRRLKAKLDVLFGASHASAHVLRLAGIQSARQVTLCVAALNYGAVDLKALGAPFNVVLFDSSDFRGLGGATFRDTRLFRSMWRRSELTPPTEATDDRWLCRCYCFSGVAGVRVRVQHKRALFQTMSRLASSIKRSKVSTTREFASNQPDAVAQMSSF